MMWFMCSNGLGHAFVNTIHLEIWGTNCAVYYLIGQHIFPRMLRESKSFKDNKAGQHTSCVPTHSWVTLFKWFSNIRYQHFVCCVLSYRPQHKNNLFVNVGWKNPKKTMHDDRCFVFCFRKSNQMLTPNGLLNTITHFDWSKVLTTIFLCALQGGPHSVRTPFLDLYWFHGFENENRME